MQDLLQFLFMRTWWTYDPDADWYAQPYHWLNLLEGSTWIVISMLVLLRYMRRRNSSLELIYCAAFATFGLSDFREAYLLQSWLILIKGVNLAALLWLRWLVLRRYYPERKSF